MVSHYILYLVSNVFNIAYARKQSLQPLKYLQKYINLLKLSNLQAEYFTYIKDYLSVSLFLLKLTLHLTTLLNHALINIF